MFLPEEVSRMTVGVRRQDVRWISDEKTTEMTRPRKLIQKTDHCLDDAMALFRRSPPLRAMTDLQSLAGANSYGKNIIERDLKCPALL